MEGKELKLGFWRRVKISVCDFDKYYLVAIEKAPRTFLYLLKLFLIFALIYAFALSYKLMQGMQNIKSQISDAPEFSFANNTFTIESDEPYIIENSDTVRIKIILSNDKSFENYENERFNGILIVLNNNQIMMRQSNENERIYDYEAVAVRYNVNELTKQNVIDLLGNHNILTTLFLYLFMTLFGTYFLYMIVVVFGVAIVGFAFARVVRLPLKFQPIFSMAGSSITLPTILNLIYVVVNLLTGFTIQNFDVMYILISYVYMMAAILLLRSNLIKNDNIKETIEKEMALNYNLNKRQEKPVEKPDDKEDEKNNKEKENKKEEQKEVGTES